MFPCACIPRNSQPAHKHSIFTNVPALAFRICAMHTHKHILEFCTRLKMLKTHSFLITLYVYSFFLDDPTRYEYPDILNHPKSGMKPDFGHQRKISNKLIVCPLPPLEV